MCEPGAQVREGTGARVGSWVLIVGLFACGALGVPYPLGHEEQAV
jgi:hypothetical protein